MNRQAVEGHRRSTDMAACAERAGEQKELKTLCVVYKERDEIQFCGQSRWIPTYGQGRGRCVMHRALHVNDKKYGEYRPGDNCCAETTRPRLQLALTAPKAKVTAWHLSHLKSTLCASEKEKRVAVVHSLEQHISKSTHDRRSAEVHREQG